MLGKPANCATLVSSVAKRKSGKSGSLSCRIRAYANLVDETKPLSLLRLRLKAAHIIFRCTGLKPSITDGIARRTWHELGYNEGDLLLSDKTCQNHIILGKLNQLFVDKVCVGHRILEPWTILSHTSHTVNLCHEEKLFIKLVVCSLKTNIQISLEWSTYSSSSASLIHSWQCKVPQKFGTYFTRKWAPFDRRLSFCWKPCPWIHRLSGHCTERTGYAPSRIWNSKFKHLQTHPSSPNLRLPSESEWTLAKHAETQAEVPTLMLLKYSLASAVVDVPSPTGYKLVTEKQGNRVLKKGIQSMPWPL